MQPTVFPVRQAFLEQTLTGAGPETAAAIGAELYRQQSTLEMITAAAFQPEPDIAALRRRVTGLATAHPLYPHLAEAA